MNFITRPARTSDVFAIEALTAPLVARGILLGKERVVFFESIQEFLVAEDEDGVIVGCGAVHVMWEDLAEVRTLAVHPGWVRRGVGKAILDGLVEKARDLGIRRLFCLTFEVDFFGRNGFEPMSEEPLDPQVFSELARSADEGVAEFLDLARVKPNTLGNTRMLRRL